MENFEVQVKRPTGRPRFKDGTPEQMAKRAMWREQHRKRRSNKGDMDNLEERRARNDAIFIEVLGPKVCAATGCTTNVHCHHQNPSAIERLHHRKIIDRSGSTYSPESIKRELKAGKCIWLVPHVNQDIENKLRAEMAEFDNATSWSSERARNHFRDKLCESITRRVIIKHQILKAVENI